jgi:hypothetical protein
VEQRHGPGLQVYGALVTKGEGVRDQHRPDQIQWCTTSARDGAPAVTPKAGGARRRLAGASPEKAARGYIAPKRMRFGPGGRVEWCEPHRGVVGDSGAL